MIKQAMIVSALVLLGCSERQEQIHQEETFELTHSPGTEELIKTGNPVSISEEFLGFQSVDLPVSLTGSLGELKDAVTKVLRALNYSQMSKEEGVDADIHVTVLDKNDFILKYTLTGLQDDSVGSEQLKVLYQTTENGYEIERIGKRWKCYRAANPNEWTTELCP